jgi:hypothetical protein
VTGVQTCALPIYTLSSLVQEFLSISYVCLLKLSHLMVVVAVHYILQNRNTNISITNNAAVLTTPFHYYVILTNVLNQLWQETSCIKIYYISIYILNKRTM